MEPAPAEETPSESALAEATYRWTIRAMYAGLLAANLYVLYDAYRDTVQMIELRAKVARLLERMRECEGCQRRKERLAAMVNRVHWEAETIKETAWAEGGEAEAGEEEVAP